jgi:ABC-type branched-subunit amino acid transport system ATPase component
VSAVAESPVRLRDTLVVRDLHRNFGGVRAVDGASLTVAPGTITGLIGPNGAGKSTLLAMIAGALKPTEGSIVFEGRELTHMAARSVPRYGVVRTFQLPSEFARLTVLENLVVAAPDQRGERLGGALLGRLYWRRQEMLIVERARALLARFDLKDKEDTYAGELSGGQKRLLEIMRCLMVGPKLLLLDEPMAGVNPALARRIERYLVELRQEGLTMLVIEHELGIVERICDPVIVMAQGRVIAQGSMEELRSQQKVLDAYLIG